MDTGDVLIILKFGFKFEDLFEKKNPAASAVSQTAMMTFQWCLRHR
jgi:hypothetical protein